MQGFATVSLTKNSSLNPRKPTDGSWRDGHLDKDREYEQEEVRTVDRKL
jgi:hypothetical protein